MRYHCQLNVGLAVFEVGACWDHRPWTPSCFGAAGVVRGAKGFDLDTGLEGKVLPTECQGYIALVPYMKRLWCGSTGAWYQSALASRDGTRVDVRQLFTFWKMISLDSRVVSLILDQLELKDVVRCASLNRLWRDVALDDSRWQRYCDSDLDEQEKKGAHLRNTSICA